MTILPPDDDDADEDRRQRAAEARRLTTLVLVGHATGAVDLVYLASALELDIELDELAATSVRRQQLISAARGDLVRQLDEEALGRQY